MARQARSLDVALVEVNAIAPRRSKVSDGGIGDVAHQKAGTSDHLPNKAGVWRARDFTHDPAGGLDCNVLAADLVPLLGNHPALGSGAYLIWNRRIISTDRLREGWRAYGGANGHTKHLHVSVATAASGYDSIAPWGIGDDMASAADIANAVLNTKDRILGGRSVHEYLRDLPSLTADIVLNYKHPLLGATLVQSQVSALGRLAALEKVVAAGGELTPDEIREAARAGVAEAIESVETTVTVKKG